MKFKDSLNILFSFIIFSQIKMAELRKNRPVNYCAIDKVYRLHNFLGKEIFYEKTIGLKCDIKNSNFTLDHARSNSIEKKIKEYLKTTKING